MNTKLFLQILLTLGCLALAVSVFGSVFTNVARTWWWVVAPEGWWRLAMACWMLIVAIRMVYPAHAK